MLNSLQDIYDLNVEVIRLLLVVNHIGHKGLYKDSDTNYFIICNNKKFLISYDIGKLLDSEFSCGKSARFNIVTFNRSELGNLIIEIRDDKLNKVR